ncbi:hypothetical protein A6A25_25550 [Saccharothrix sp. CB00851]|nr:hypothetical protein A6A25_25550 [Saccharothrix sp. CB00851]
MLSDDQVDATRIPAQTFADTIADFHTRIDALSPAVAATIEKIRNGAPIVRLAHQPNLFPHLNLLAQIYYVDYLTEHRPDVAPVVLIVDQDDVSDRWLHTSLSWSRDAPGTLVRHSTKPYLPNRRRIISRTRLAVDAVVRVQAAAAHYLSTLSPQRSPEHWRSLLWPRQHRECSDVDLTEFHSAPLVRSLANTHGLPTAFCPLSRLYTRAGPAASLILNRLVELDPAFRDHLPLWSVCDSCSTRNDLTALGDDYLSRCRVCGSEAKFPVTDLLLDPERFPSTRTAPKVLLDTLLDYTALPTLGGSNYLGGRSHLEVSTALAAELFGWSPLEACWRGNPVDSSVIDRDISARVRLSAPAHRAAHAHLTGRISMLSMLTDENMLTRLRDAVSEKADRMTSGHPDAVTLVLDRDSMWLNDPSLKDFRERITGSVDNERSAREIGSGPGARGHRLEQVHDAGHHG